MQKHYSQVQLDYYLTQALPGDGGLSGMNAWGRVEGVEANVVLVANKVVGQPTGRADGPEKVTGRARYGEDAHIVGTLWCRILRSPYPHALIRKIDISNAAKLQGVRAILTGQDVKGMRTGSVYKDEPLLCWDRVLAAGDKVAAVVADDEDIAQQALDLIEVDYEELPAVLDPEEAVKPGAPILHPEFSSYVGVVPLKSAKFSDPTNVYVHLHHEKGNVDQGFREADFVVEKTYGAPLIHQGYLEPHSVMVIAEPDGAAQIWCSTQSPKGVQTEIARLFNLPPEKVVVNFSYIGGSFGGKADGTGVALCYLLSKRTGRPVKLVLDYTEELQNMDMRHPAKMRVRAGVKKDGTITAWESEVFFAGGAYAAYAPVPQGLSSAMEIVGPYRIANVRIDSYQTYTNTSPCSYARAPGLPQVIFAGESHVDVLAHTVGMDPLDFRLRNIVHDGDELPSGHKYQELRVEEVLREAARASGYYDRKSGSVGRGLAIGAHSQIGGDAHVAVTILPDGQIEAGLPNFDPGVGTFTIVGQAIAEELAVPVGRVKVVPWSTAMGPFDFGVGGSRGARMYSAAGYGAATDARQKLGRLAAEFLGWAEERIGFEDGHVVNQATNERVPYERIVQRMGSPITGKSDLMEGFDSPWTSFGVHVVETAVDSETGEFKLQKYTAVHETGRILNPVGFYGQIEGGIVQGIGDAIMEGLFYDESGRVTNPSFADMKIPNIKDIPELKIVVLESNSGHGPYKVRGIGEHTNILAAAAIANAIDMAVGVRITDKPITSEKVRQGLTQKAQGKTGGRKK